MLGAGVSSGCRRRDEAPADLVLVNGIILTVDANDAVAEAVAVADGKIVSVGSRASMDAHVGDRTRVIDLNGRTATPGKIDSHVHLSAAAAL